MPGSQRNSWNSYLNGGTSHYNFSYKDNALSPSIQESLPPNKPIPIPQIPNTPSQLTTQSISNKKKQSGGKRKTKRRHKKYKQTITS
jgi:hypothetical protein